jgi:hypothetical protein
MHALSQGERGMIGLRAAVTPPTLLWLWTARLKPRPFKTDL